MSCQALGSGLSAGRSVVTAFVGLSVLWAAVRVSSQLGSNAGEGEPGVSPHRSLAAATGCKILHFCLFAGKCVSDKMQNLCALSPESLPGCALSPPCW